MTSKITLEQMEQQIAQLPVHERLKLIAYISQQLSALGHKFGDVFSSR